MWDCQICRYKEIVESLKDAQRRPWQSWEQRKKKQTHTEDAGLCWNTALLMSWLILLQTPGNRAGVLACKGLYLSKSVSNLDQEFAWAVIIPKSLYFWCHLIALKFLCVSWSSPQKPHGHKLHMRPCKDEVQGRGQNMCLELILAPAP